MSTSAQMPLAFRDREWDERRFAVTQERGRVRGDLGDELVSIHGQNREDVRGSLQNHLSVHERFSMGTTLN